MTFEPVVLLHSFKDTYVHLFKPSNKACCSGLLPSTLKCWVCMWGSAVQPSLEVTSQTLVCFTSLLGVSLSSHINNQNSPSQPFFEYTYLQIFVISSLIHDTRCLLCMKTCPRFTTVETELCPSHYHYFLVTLCGGIRMYVMHVYVVCMMYACMLVSADVCVLQWLGGVSDLVSHLVWGGVFCIPD